VRLQNFVECHLVIGEKPLGRLHLGPSAASGWNAEVRPLPHRRQQQRGTGVQSFIAEIRGVHFHCGPRCDHRCHSIDEGGSLPNP
jgi:hypothetical protein